MDTLEEGLYEGIMKVVNAPKTWALLTKKYLENQGISLSNHQVRRLTAYFRASESSSISFRVREDQLSPSVPDIVRETKSVQINDDELQVEFERFVSASIKSMEDKIPDLLDQLSSQILVSMDRDRKSLLFDRETDRTGFERRLRQVWGQAFDDLEVLLASVQEIGGEFNHKERGCAASESDFVFEVVVRLHAKACQIFSEVVSLMKSGHADGAMARWRSLHEVVVVSMLVKSEGSDLAERYLLHDAIGSYRAAKVYAKHYEQLGLEPLSIEEVVELRQTHDALVERFGKDFAGEYGWAAEALKKTRPNFSDLELMVGLDHMRPYYRMASNNIHANPRGVFFSLGLTSEGTDVLLAGPSNAGLADPGDAAAISLYQATVTMLTTKTNLDRLVVLSALKKLTDRIGEKLIKAHTLIEKSYINNAK